MAALYITEVSADLSQTDLQFNSINDNAKQSSSMVMSGKTFHNCRRKQGRIIISPGYHVNDTPCVLFGKRELEKSFNRILWSFLKTGEMQKAHGNLLRYPKEEDQYAIIYQDILLSS